MVTLSPPIAREVEYGLRHTIAKGNRYWSERYFPKDKHGVDRNEHD